MSLIIEAVTENGPAWKCGVVPGDVIVTVDDWLITVMDKPQVNLVFLMNCGIRTKQEIEFLPCVDIVTNFLLLFSVYD